MSDVAIGIDIGGTRTKSGLVNIKTGEVKKMIVQATEKEDESKFRFQLTSAIREHLSFAIQSDQKVLGIGIGVSSFVDRRGMVDSTYGFLTFMENYPLASVIEKEFHLRCKVDNDARLVALGEATYGKGKGFDRVLVLTLGTGLGVGFVCDGKFEDQLPYAHMAGHITVTQNDHLCYCGKTGCLESLVSAAGILYAGEKINWTKKYTKISLTPEAIFAAAEGGNKDAQSIINELVDYLQIGIHNYINLFSPGVIVIGGGIAKGIKPYLGSLTASNYLKPFKNYTVEMAISELHEHAGVLGGAALIQLQQGQE